MDYVVILQDHSTVILEEHIGLTTMKHCDHNVTFSNDPIVILKDHSTVILEEHIDLTTMNHCVIL